MYDCYGRFADLYDVLMDDVDYGLWTSSLEKIIRKELPGQREISILDCACGTGEISTRLAKAGFSVTGLDISADMLRVAQDKTRRNGLRIPFVCMDMTEISLHRKTDVITCCCDGVNYLTSEAQADAFFRSAADNLKDGGLLLFDLSTPYKLEHVLGGTMMGEDREECTYLWENLYDPKNGLLEMRLHFFVPADGKKSSWARFDETHIQKGYDTDTITRLLEKNGFSLISAMEAFTGSEPGETCERIQYAARRISK